jgi:hypothetical protein
MQKSELHEQHGTKLCKTNQGRDNQDSKIK